jgi:hypothetical protein
MKGKAKSGDQRKQNERGAGSYCVKDSGVRAFLIE